MGPVRKVCLRKPYRKVNLECWWFSLSSVYDDGCKTRSSLTPNLLKFIERGLMYPLFSSTPP